MLNRRGINIWILSFIWPAVELIRSCGTLGFPWISLSNSLIEYNTVIQNIEYIGMYGLTSWIVIINILIYYFLSRRSYYDAVFLAVIILGLKFNHLFLYLLLIFLFIRSYTYVRTMPIYIKRKVILLFDLCVTSVLLCWVDLATFYGLIKFIRNNFTKRVNSMKF